VAYHHAINLPHKPAENREFIAFQLIARAIDLRQIVMGIDPRRGVAREMFSAARDAFRAKRIVESSCVPNDLLDRFPITTASQGIVRFVVERNVQHRTEIEIEPKEAQEAAGNPAVTPNECELVLIAQLLRVRRFISNQTQTRDPTTFLVDGDNWLDLAEVAQVVDQFSKLDRAGNVPTEKDEAAGLDAPEKHGRLAVQFRAGNTAKKELSQLVLLHAHRL
jgi:hypothetical protein